MAISIETYSGFSKKHNSTKGLQDLELPRALH